MPHYIEWKPNGVIVSFSGTVAASEIMEANAALYGDSRFEEIDFQIFDFLNITQAIGTITDAKIIGALDKSSSIWNNHIKGALLTTNPYIIELIEEYKKSLVETEWQIKVFNNMADAEKWLNI